MRAALALWAVWFACWLLAGLSTEKAKASENAGARAATIALLTGAFFFLFSDQLRFGYLGLRLWPESALVSRLGNAATAAGLLFCVWARVHLGRYWSARVQIKEGHRLIRTGPYAFVRHPIYTGFLLAIAGSAVTLGEVRGAVVMVSAAAACLRKIRLEERVLGREFGGEYEAYRTRTKSLVPFIL